MNHLESGTATEPFDPRAVTRPVKTLLWYYLIVSCFTLIAFPVVFLVNFFKYETLIYRFDDEGISMSWGILFRRETVLAYRRIQDIHLTRNIIQRWMGLATVSIQTASGSASAEMQIEGIPQYEALRDFLYMKMRGAKGLAEPEDAMTAAAPGQGAAGVGSHGAAAAAHDTGDAALALLREIADDLALLRHTIQRRDSGDRT